MQIIRATKNDIPDVVNLISIILDDMELPILLQNDRSKVLELFEATFKSSLYLGDAADIIVAKNEGQILGTALGYRGTEEATLFQEFNQHFSEVGLTPQTVFSEPEASADEWYLNSLAVSPHAQHQGIGSQLLQSINGYANKRGVSKIGLLVDFENPQAEKLYQRNGFNYWQDQSIGTHQYRHLQKSI